MRYLFYTGEKNSKGTAFFNCKRHFLRNANRRMANLTFRWPSFVINSSNKNQLDALITQIYFWNKILHVSDSSSVHHQEFFTVNTAMVYVIQFFWQQAVSKTICIAVCTVHVEFYSKNKFEKWVHLVGFIIRRRAVTTNLNKHNVGFITHSTRVFLCCYAIFLMNICTCHLRNDHWGTNKRGVWCLTVRHRLHDSIVCDMKTNR